MRLWPVVSVPLILAALVNSSYAGRFVVFPKAGESSSPDGRYVVRNSDREGATSDFVGVFHSLWLVELANGRSRKLCDYLGVAAVAWSDDDFLVVNEYAGKRTSRAMLFSATDPEYAVTIDKTTVARISPPELRAALEGNDHAFVEASRLTAKVLFLRVWGYGQRNPNGFRWVCEYGMEEGSVSCSEAPSRNR